MKTTATIQQLRETLEITNKRHGYKLEFNRIEQFNGKQVLFTLKSPSKIRGSRTSHSGRNLAKARTVIFLMFYLRLIRVRLLSLLIPLLQKTTVIGKIVQ